MALKLPTINWILDYVTLALFTISIYGPPQDVLLHKGGLKMFFPHSLFLVKLFAPECLSRVIVKEKNETTIKGIRVTNLVVLTHFLFTYAIFLFGHGTHRE